MALTNSSVRGFHVLPTFKDIVVLPKRSTAKSAGYDLQSTSDYVIKPGQRALVSTGVTAYMLQDEELQIRPRSGLALKKGISLVNSPGTIDSDYYPNEIGVIIINHSDDEFIIKAGDRIAQAVFGKYLLADGDSYNGRERIGGYGHTGA